MDRELKTKWVEALRSGKYKQAHGRLRRRFSYCCLGVLCKVAGAKFTDNGQRAEYKGVEVPASGYIPPNLMVPLEHQRCLVEMNDQQHHKFDEIADYVERHL